MRGQGGAGRTRRAARKWSQARAALRCHDRPQTRDRSPAQRLRPASGLPRAAGPAADTVCAGDCGRQRAQQAGQAVGQRRLARATRGSPPKIPPPAASRRRRWRRDNFPAPRNRRNARPRSRTPRAAIMASRSASVSPVSGEQRRQSPRHVVVARIRPWPRLRRSRATIPAGSRPASARARVSATCATSWLKA